MNKNVFKNSIFNEFLYRFGIVSVASLITLFYKETFSIKTVSVLMMIATCCSWISSAISPLVLEKIGGKRTYILGFVGMFIGSLFATLGYNLIDNQLYQTLSIYIGFVTIDIFSSLKDSGDTSVIINNSGNQIEKFWFSFNSIKSLAIVLGTFFFTFVSKNHFGISLIIYSFLFIVIFINIRKNLKNINDFVTKKGKNKNNNNFLIEYLKVFKNYKFTLYFLSLIMMSSVLSQRTYYLPIHFGKDVAPISFLIIAISSTFTIFLLKKIKLNKNISLIINLLFLISFLIMLLTNKFSVIMITSAIFGISGTATISLLLSDVSKLSNNHFSSSIISSQSSFSSLIASWVLFFSSDNTIVIFLQLIVIVILIFLVYLKE